MKYILTILYLIFTSLGVYFMKIGGDSLKLSFNGLLNFKIGYITLIGFLWYIISFLIYQKLIVTFNLSTFVPIVTAIVQVVVFLIGVIILKEKINLANVFGIMFLIIGVICLSYKK